jgi:hypothetical protein
MFAVVGVASADIGIVRVSPTRVRPGDRVAVTAAGYLGMTRQVFTVVLMPSAKAPKPYSCMNGTAVCTPAFLPARLRLAPFTAVGKIRRWQRVGPRGVRQGRATLTFRFPRVAAGRYKLGLFCPSCTRGPKGSLIVADKVIVASGPARTRTWDQRIMSPLL